MAKTKRRYGRKMGRKSRRQRESGKRMRSRRQRGGYCAPQPNGTYVCTGA